MRTYDTNEYLFSQVDEALELKNTDIAKELCLPPVKLHCSSKYYYFISNLVDVCAMG